VPDGATPAAPAAIVGAGAWGTALAQTLAVAGREVRLWCRDPALAERLDRERRNPAYLPGVPLSGDIAICRELADALGGAGVAILAVPTHAMAAIAERCASHLAAGCVAVSAAKGFEVETGATMTSVLGRVLRDGWPVAALSGPNIAIEIARGLPAASVVGAGDEATGRAVRQALTGQQLRVYSNCDVTGVEYGGALKNVVAIAAGICDGLGAGDNGKAAVITRGLAEMSRLGVAAGADPFTFAGLAGLGDCVATCASPHSRNRRLGEAIGRGQSLAQVEAGMFQVAEGINATRSARMHGRRLGVSTPIVDEVFAVLFEDKPVAYAISDLMARDTRDEH
jgi:glycerol-3-phosphate dehydrogenase (NAD(P)+)